MNSRERVLSTLSHAGYDRLPVKHEGTPEVNAMLMAHFGLTNEEQLLRMLGDDFRYVQPEYCGPELRTFPDGSIEGFWGERYSYKEYEGGRYLEPVFLPFKGVMHIKDLDTSHFPTVDHFDFSDFREKCQAIHNDFIVCIGSAGDMDFINTIGRMRGMEQVLEDLLTQNEVFMAIMEARFHFYYTLHKKMLESADGLVDIVHVGEDLGNQSGPTISMETFEHHFAERYKNIFDLAHAHGARTMMHMCGCVRAFLPRLIELGLDIMDVVQPATPDMDIADLVEAFGDRLTFCGSICVQKVLPFGTKEDVEHEVHRRQILFPKGGFILGPTHAIQVGTPLENILTLYSTAGSLRPRVDEFVLSAASQDEEEEFDRFKLF